MKKVLSAIVLSSALVLFSTPLMATNVTEYTPASNSYSSSSTRSNAQSDQSQGQIQGQGQAQNQSQAQILANSGNSAVVFDGSFNGADPIRYLPMATDVHYQGMSPQMFSRPQQDKGENFISAVNLINMMGAWSINDLSDPDFDLDDVDIDLTIVNKSSDLSSNILVDDDAKIMFCIQGTDVEKNIKSQGSKILALGTIKSDDEDINSIELFYALAMKAKEIQGSNIILIGEGVKIELKSSGWGVGLSYNMATVNSDAYGQGSVGAGGTGISGGSASYSKMPYLTFAIME